MKRAVASLAMVCFAANARAETNHRPYRVNWAVDASLVAAEVGALLLPRRWLRDSIEPRCPCDPSEVNSFDRGALGLDSEPLSTGSDVVWGFVVVGAIAGSGADTWISGSGWTALWEDLIVLSQSLLLSSVLYQATTLAHNRPRPFIYGLPMGDPELERRTNYVSFFSGHTSTAFAASLSAAFTYARRHPRSSSRHAVYAAAITLASVVGALRVASGRHFPSDVLVGAAVGSAVGLVVPWLHTKPKDLRVSLLPSEHGATLAFTLWR